MSDTPLPPVRRVEVEQFDVWRPQKKIARPWLRRAERWEYMATVSSAVGEI